MRIGSDDNERTDGTDRIRSLVGGDTEDEVECRECNGRFGQITSSHLSLHGMTMLEYRQDHPDAPLQPNAVVGAGGWSEETHGPDTRARISEAIAEKHENGEYNSANER